MSPYDGQICGNFFVTYFYLFFFSILGYDKFKNVLYTNEKDLLGTNFNLAYFC